MKKEAIMRERCGDSGGFVERRGEFAPVFMTVKLLITVLYVGARISLL